MLRELVAHPLLAGRSRLVADATGVGAPVVDLLRASRLDCPLTPVTITTSGVRLHSRGEHACSQTGLDGRPAGDVREQGTQNRPETPSGGRPGKGTERCGGPPPSRGKLANGSGRKPARPTNLNQRATLDSIPCDSSPSPPRILHALRRDLTQQGRRFR
jgi:hypothetical protein